MADAFLPIVLENLNSLIRSEVGLLCGVEEEMEKLSSTLSTIRAVLADAEKRQGREEAVKDWLLKLKHAAYDIDDILDECVTEASGQNSGLIKTKVLASFLTSCHPPKVLFRHKIGTRMRNIREKLDEISKERVNFHLNAGAVERRVEANEGRETGSIFTKSEALGRDADKEKIVQCLVKDVADCENVSIYPIIGIGGLGKTTLAQLVFNDERVKEHFKPIIWVCIPEIFDLKSVIQTILQSAGEDVSEALPLAPLQDRLQKKLKENRFLLVLDDVWNEDSNKWSEVKRVLECGSKGAAIVVTTRVKMVAKIMGTLAPHELPPLLTEDCWSLLRQCAFGNDAEERSDLVAIGRKIVDKCQGVPLVARALGGLLRFEEEISVWRSIAESEIWNLQEENSIIRALKLSYSHLPLKLRQCFAYCAIFPKDTVIEKEVIINLWMANGFISSNGNLELEDIGNTIWKELYMRSFFQNVKKDFLGNITSFKMHDLMHDVAQSVVKDECCIMEADKGTDFSKRIRHMSVVAADEEQFLVSIREASNKLESLRTLLLPPMHMPFSSDFLKFSFLRVLIVRGNGISEVPSSIGNLKHLRYLEISHAINIRMLPESICSLWNLQTLNIEGCRFLKKLPKQMSRLRNLRHLYMDGCESLTEMPPSIGQLTHLKRLSIFIVGEGRGFQIGELQGLNLRGKLQIKHLERVKNGKDAEEAKLVGKQNLQELHLCWESNEESELQENAGNDQVLEALKPAITLKCLEIQGYKGAYFPLWMGNQVLKDVASISLFQCKNCRELPPFGKLPCLKTLVIKGMNCVEYIVNESHGEAMMGGFTSLIKLEISDMQSLKEWSREEGIGRIYSMVPFGLTSLIIDKCPKISWRSSNEQQGSTFSSLISNLHRLTYISVADNEEVTGFPPDGMLRNLTALQTLELIRFTKLQELPTDLASLIALQRLRIEGCHELECLPEQGLQGLTSLRDLHIWNCKKFECLSEGLQHLTALESLRVLGCPELVDLPEGIKHLTALQTLHISGGRSEAGMNRPKLVVLPEALRHLTSLQILWIGGYPDLASLPDFLGNLTSLKTLSILYCPNIASLPASIQNLTQLRRLEIGGCSSELARRCEKETGEDWYKICHIPTVSVGSSDLLRLFAILLHP